MGRGSLKLLLLGVKAGGFRRRGNGCLVELGDVLVLWSFWEGMVGLLEGKCLCDVDIRVQMPSGGGSIRGRHWGYKQ